MLKSKIIDDTEKILEEVADIKKQLVQFVLS